MSTRPKPQRLSLLITDVDGTLVDENKIVTPPAAAAMRTLWQNGVRFAVTKFEPTVTNHLSPEFDRAAKVVGFSDDYAGEIATIGDTPNDVLMFRKSGFSIAMGTSSAEVQSQADAVTASYNNDGFAKAIERDLLDEGGRPDPVGRA